MVRPFVKPTSNNEFQLNFKASHFWNMVDLEDNIFEPPMTVGFTLEQLERFTIPNLSNHSQIVEHYVQDVCQEAQHSSSDDDRNANVLILAFYRKCLKGKSFEEMKPFLADIESMRIQVKNEKRLSQQENFEELDLSVNIEDIFLSETDVEMESASDQEVSSIESNQEDYIDDDNDLFLNNSESDFTFFIMLFFTIKFG